MDNSTLAILGGNPVRRKPFPKWPFFDADEVEAVSRVLESGNVNYWTGNECRAFEAEFSEYVGRKFAITLANGTLALELALHALDVGPGDEVIVPSRTFIATASSVVARGATPICCDVDEYTGNISVDSARTKVSKKTRAIIPVHVGGWPCEMDAIAALASEFGLHVIEDCSQAHGASFKSNLVGSFGVCSTFSFCQEKIMTTGGEGGLLLTDSPEIWRRAWSFKDHGKSAEIMNRAVTSSAFRWSHETFGSNFRLSEMQAAIGRIQLGKLRDWVEMRRHNSGVLMKSLAGIPSLEIRVPPNHLNHSWYRLYIFLRLEYLLPGWNLERVIAAICAEGVPVGSGTCSEIYRENAFSTINYSPTERFKNAASFSERSIALLVHPTLTSEALQDYIDAIVKVVSVACSSTPIVDHPNMVISL